MAQESQIRNATAPSILSIAVLCRRRCGFFRRYSQARTGNVSPWEDDCSKHIHALTELPYLNFIRRKTEFKFIGQKPLDFRSHVHKLFAAIRHNKEVVVVSHVRTNTKFLLHEVIELVKIYVREKLGGEIAERQALARQARETFDNFFSQIEIARILDGLANFTRRIS